MRHICKESISSVSLACVVLLTFLVQYFNNILQSISAYLFFLILFTILFVSYTPKKKVVRKSIFDRIWLISLCVLIISYIPAKPYISVYADIVVYICGLLIIFFSGYKNSIYGQSVKVVKCVSVYYAFSILVQFLIPSLYDVYLSLLTIKDRIAVVDFENLQGMYTGFSTNCGFTAAHLSSGILCYISTMRYDGKYKKNIWIVFALFMALLMTGKRSTFIFVVFSILLLYIFSVKGSGKIKIYTYILFFSLLVLILYYMFSSFFLIFPVVSRIIQSIDGVIMGLDITSHRSIYYDYALSLFFDNPWFGIGWGNYRNMTLGHVTWVNTVEVHNIYLQMLTEMGIIGFVGMAIPMIMIWMKTKKIYKNLIFINVVKDKKWIALISYSLTYQTFFLLQGFTENPLYDINFLLMYLVCCSIPSVYIRYDKILKILR